MTWTILYFGTDWSALNRTSSHHVARGLARDHHLLYFECPGMRPPVAAGRDLRRLAAKLWQGLRPARHPQPNVEVRTLLQLPFHGSPLVRRLNRALLRRAVRRQARRARARGRPVISWFTVPHVGHLIGTLDEDAGVYYCVDDYAAFPGVDQASVRAMDAQLTRDADLVFAVSEPLFRQKQDRHPRVRRAPHGVDLAHFGRARTRGAPPADLPAGEPRIGYFGSVAPWIDLDLIRTLAERHPDWQFVMIGPVSVEEAQLPRLANIHFLGRKPYEALPEYGAWFDAAIIPYRSTQQVAAANPMKLREYLAMEKPVVATATPEIEVFGDVVRLARDTDEWDAALTAVLRGDDAREMADRARERLRGMDWRDRIDTIRQEVESLLAERKARGD